MGIGKPLDPESVSRVLSEPRPSLTRVRMKLAKYGYLGAGRYGGAVILYVTESLDLPVAR